MEKTKKASINIVSKTIEQSLHTLVELSRGLLPEEEALYTCYFELIKKTEWIKLRLLTLNEKECSIAKAKHEAKKETHRIWTTGD